jgi:hypothetical protein
MSIFGRLLGSDKALDIAEKGLTGGMSLLDAAFYTDQEKAENKQKMTEAWLKTQELIGKESSPTSISRRIIAWSVIGMTIVTFACGLIFIGFGADARLDILIKWSVAMKLDWAFVGVIGFYFGAHLIRK